MDDYRLRVRVGATEFEAQGPEALVHQDYEAWKELLDRVGETPAAIVDTPRGDGNALGSHAGNGQVGPVEAQDLAPIFSYDETSKIISLRYLPQGDDREATAMLLVLLGYKQIAGRDEVGVTQLKSALVQSGVSVDRIDRDAAPPLVRDQLVLRGGKGKGGRYKLTNTGAVKAFSEARKLLQQI